MPQSTQMLSTVELPNGSSPLDGVLTAGQPSAAQLQQLARAGLKSVIDLRAAGEPRGFDEAATAAAAGLAYHNIPVTAVSLGAAAFEQVRTLLRDRDLRPVLVHCASANRVGALLIPYLVLDEHRSSEDAMGIARAVGLRGDDLAHAATTYVAEQQARPAPKSD